MNSFKQLLQRIKHYLPWWYKDAATRSRAILGSLLTGNVAADSDAGKGSSGKNKDQRPKTTGALVEGPPLVTGAFGRAIREAEKFTFEPKPPLSRYRQFNRANRVEVIATDSPLPPGLLRLRELCIQSTSLS